ncbi:hypothetical protein [Bremerella alba]|uniref:Uncharacterized protein n=1 Tax=Bremerella alba TaxID=980252 RepID=A0A7V8V7Y2_9BACT|nr:hypothetical protein [Bremerella alba]MBA2116622.1 hypothetical protein [Bremerella alba]
MLEDSNQIDMVLKGNNGEVVFVIIDGGVTTDPDKRLELLNHKVQCCAGALCDQDQWEELGCPSDVAIEVQCQFEVNEEAPPKQLNFTTPDGRDIEMAIRFVAQPSPYGS